MTTPSLVHSSPSPVAPASPVPRFPIRLGYLGQPDDHAATLTRMLAGCRTQKTVPPPSPGIAIPGPGGGGPPNTLCHGSLDPPLLGIPLSILPDSVTHGIYASADQNEPAALIRKLSRLRNQLLGTRHPDYLRTQLHLIDRQHLDCLLAYWGTGILGDVAAFKRCRPRLKIIVNVLCHPTGLTAGKILLQNLYLRRMARHLDGLIVPSEAMRAYLEQHVLAGRAVPQLIWPPCYSQDLFPTHSLTPYATVPNLLFLGRTDWRRAQPADNVRPLLDQLLASGVHVYHCRSSHAPSAALVPPHPGRHTFGYMPLREALTYATQFDAALIAYNLAGWRDERFRNTVPDRLVAAVAAGIPVALPASGYDAAREYLGPYGAAIEFRSAGDLAEQLADRPRIIHLRELAQRNSSNYAAERYVPRLLDFVSQVVG